MFLRRTFLYGDEVMLPGIPLLEFDRIHMKNSPAANRPIGMRGPRLDHAPQLGGAAFEYTCSLSNGNGHGLCLTGFSTPKPLLTGFPRSYGGC